MSKTFTEVLPGFQGSAETEPILKWIVIQRVSRSRALDTISIYLTAERLIPKRLIYKLEGEIKKQYFSTSGTKIRIFEDYRLSDAWSASYLLEQYRDSLLLELKYYSHLLYNMFDHAELIFPAEDELMVEVDDNLIARSKGQELEKILHKVLNERFHMNILVRLIYVKHDKEAQVRREEQESFIEQETRKIVDEIMKRKQEVGEEKEEFLTAGKQEKKKTSEKAVVSAGKQKNTDMSAGKQKQTSAADSSASKSKYQKGFTGKKNYSNGEARNYPKKSEDMIYGRYFEGPAVPLEEIQGEMGEVIVHGEIRDVEFKELKTGSTICLFHLFDGTDTIGVKTFSRADMVEDLKTGIKKGSYVAVKGIAALDSFDREVSVSSVRGIKKEAAPEKHVRMDKSPKKRVELHCHTKFSELDSVADVSELMKTVYDWDMPALAITDHGNVQAFTEAFHRLDSKKSFKMLYGMEGYLVDDLINIVENPGDFTLDDTFVVFDLETTGLNNNVHKIIEIGAVKVEKGVVVDRFSAFVNPHEPISFEIEELTGINDSMVKDADSIEKVLPEFLQFCEGAALVGHNASFDVNFILKNAKNLHIPLENVCWLCTMRMARFFFPNSKKATLDHVAKELGITLNNHHRAVNDAECTAGIFIEFIKKFKERKVFTLKDVNRVSAATPELIRKNPQVYHIVMIAKNDLGRVNLYRLVSESHLTYFNRRPRIPKSLLMENREGLIIGSACEAGELFQAILLGVDDARITELVNFYDYLEIQPICNNRFMLKQSKYGVSSDEDLQELNRKIYNLGKVFNKPVVATCDSHFMKPEDAIYRSIILAGQGFKDTDEATPLYFRTTEEMLDEFRYLGDKEAEEVVITNTNLIADMCDRIEPVRPDKCPPVIENSDRDLRDMCYEKAHSIYGEELPQVVVDRLEKELHSIISNGFAVMYIIAQKLVWKSNEDGYLVGSRGSVGSSFVATMSGITEVNPLSPHYYCSECHYYDFDSEEVRAFSGMAGCDMPDKKCPVCGAPLHKDGFDIPFETFLGFKGDKEPDIDLNFSGEYQSKAHDYTEVIFGKGNTFRAGTIGTLADKTAFGYVKKYYEERGITKRRCEMERIASGFVGVKRGTGQHPGGIIVMPHGEEIYSFTPVQHPANDMTTKTITTHFDYHSIDHNLLKLDILGHDDPTMIRMLEDLIGIDARTIPLDNKEVMSLFRSTDALGITPDDIDGTPLGTLGIPEFGTDFAMQMLIDTQPKYFSDLVRIAGLAHGTDVWLGNAQDLIVSGTATIQTAICTRDDIMIYLIGKGMDSEKSFKLMEKVRKGKGLTPEEQEAMRENNVPEWYIQSCLKIKYMFPKAHAAAYVMMAWRIAYCKIFYPLEYYTAYFSIRADAFNYELMCLGREVLDRHLHILQNSTEKISAMEKTMIKDMRIVQEMYARGFEFMPIDIYKAKATRFQIIDGKIMPSFASIDGLGETVAVKIEEAAKDGQFLSLEDFAARTKATSTNIAVMKRLGLFGDIPDTNQLDFLSMIADWDSNQGVE
ncbi:MAG: PolC-type DNA polymerase III [Lachnospiraceae bacterium]|nr:PolC-type DNA polymerase III [Lachnospiraceae bacterium]